MPSACAKTLMPRAAHEDVPPGRNLGVVLGGHYDFLFRAEDHAVKAGQHNPRRRSHGDDRCATILRVRCHARPVMPVPELAGQVRKAARGLTRLSDTRKLAHLVHEALQHVGQAN